MENVTFCNVASPETSVIEDIAMDIDHVTTPAALEIVPVKDDPLIVAPGTTVIEPEPLTVAVSVQLLELLY
jgi:hypothetical protein